MAQRCPLPPPPAVGVALDRLSSYPVSEDLQRRKLREGRAVLPEVPGPERDVSYLRRGPRSNEMSFQYDVASLRAVVRAFRETD